MKHADKLVERILFLEGVPNLQKLGRVRVGQDDARSSSTSTSTSRSRRVARLNAAIALCVAEGDNTSRDLLEDILEERGRAPRLARDPARPHQAARARSRTWPSSSGSRLRTAGVGLRGLTAACEAADNSEQGSAQPRSGMTHGHHGSLRRARRRRSDWDVAQEFRDDAFAGSTPTAATRC